MKHLLANNVRIFLSIVESGSITAAANHLSMGKSGVSDALKQLESSLGVQLLIRTTRRQSLTTVGKQFYRQCRALNDISTMALEEISGHLTEPVGALRITAPNATIEDCVAPALAKLISQYPRIEPELIIDDKRIDLIEHNIDLALTVGELPDSEFRAQRVGVLKDVLCASPAFLKAHKLKPKTEISLDDIQKLPYVANHWQGAKSTYTLATNSKKNSKNTTTLHFKRVATVNSVNAIVALIKQGVGISALPHFLVQKSLDSGELIELLPHHSPCSTNIYAIHPYSSTPPLGVRAMIEEIRQQLDAGL
ncbi:LysR family transcriptional regulator [Sessilibacter corallicola]|uniref:LysR family transcriptional regulator n=1 Tax=Sessilibacter corallicola TaxID=2904075 RepID=UPI001E41EAC9|nr:LysR family transcriptional regulator [Sessilibacter corallicola]MCE2029380.1 LysR family transcriptional regulator [Sessilibacter corallicola]